MRKALQCEPVIVSEDVLPRCAGRYCTSPLDKLWQASRGLSAGLLDRIAFCHAALRNCFENYLFVEQYKLWSVEICTSIL